MNSDQPFVYNSIVPRYQTRFVPFHQPGPVTSQMAGDLAKSTLITLWLWM